VHLAVIFFYDVSSFPSFFVYFLVGAFLVSFPPFFFVFVASCSAAYFLFFSSSIADNAASNCTLLLAMRLFSFSSGLKKRG
jgi:hypothetical protein